MSGSDETLDRLAQEYVRRLRDGEAVEVDEYADAHPELAERIHELFPVLVLMEGLKPPTQVGAAPPSPAPASDVPVRIGPYVVRRELGRGGMGRVYEVRDSRERRLALKVVHPHLLDRPGFLARFLREVETGLRIDHPGVVTTLESGVAAYGGHEVPYLVLEYVEGSTLREVLDEAGGVSERLAREIGTAVADALEAIHAAGIVHRDVKPENVVIAPDETVKLMDLGVALVQEEALRLTQTGEFVGSLLYASPEQLRSGQVDARSDLFALGLLLHELIVGRHPASEGRGAVLARRFGDAPLPRLREVAPSTTPFFEAVVERLLAASPEKRFASAAELRTVLREGEQGAWWRAQESARAEPTRPRPAEGAPAFVGRRADRAALDAAYAAVRAGEGQLRVVVGEAGLGKSRLLMSWLDERELDAEPPAVLWIEHGPGAGALGLAPLADALRRLLGAGAEARVRGALADQTEAAARFLEHLASPGDDHPGLDRATLEGLYRTVLRSIATERPLVLVVEDLHFASSEVRAWLDRLVPTIASDPILLLATCRPEVHDDWLRMLTAAEHADVLRLAGLDAEEGATLFAEALGAELGELAAAQDVVRSADGNPFCLIEFAAELQAHARSDRARPGDAPHLPDSVQRLVEERLAALSPEEHDLLSVAACCGDRFDPMLVCEAAGLPRIAGLRMLHRADREHRVIAEEGAAYRFRHHLVQEGMHGSLPPALRAAYHTALAAAREARLGDEPPSDADSFAIARHFLLGDQPARAHPYVRAGLEHLAALGETRRAARLARRALEALPDAEPSLRARILMVRARSLDGRVDPQQVLEISEQALATAEQTDDDRLLVEAIRGVGVSCARIGRHDLSWPYAERSVEVARRTGDAALLAMTLDDWSSCLYDMGRHEEALTVGAEAIGYAGSGGDPLHAGRVMMTLAGQAVESGRLEEAYEQAERAVTTSHLHGDQPTERAALGVLVRIATAQCEFDGAHALCDRLEAMAREEGNLRMLNGCQLARAHVLFNEGEIDAADDMLRECSEVAERMGYRESEVLISSPWMALLGFRGDFGRAHAVGLHALERLAVVPLPAVGARVHPRMATLLAWMGDVDGAREHAERGRQLAEASRVARERMMVAHVAANLLDAQGETEAAADAYQASYEQHADDELTLYVLLVGLRAGGLAVRCERHDDARRMLEHVAGIAQTRGVRVVSAEARVWSELLPEGNPAHARVVLERDRACISALARIRLLRILAERLGEPTLAAEADALAARVIASAPEAYRARMRADVPLFASSPS